MRLRSYLFLSFVLIMNTAMAADSLRWISPNLGIQKLTPGIYLIKSWEDAKKDKVTDANHLLVVDQQDIVLINTPWTNSNTRILLDWINKEFNRPVSKVIITHFHYDCSGGAAEIRKSGITTYSLDKTKYLLRSDSMNIAVTFHDSLDIPLQTLHLNLTYPGEGHTRDNIVVWIPEDQILYGGCLVKSNAAIDLGNVKDAAIKAWPKTIQKLQNRFGNARIIIPGHYEIGDTSLLRHTLELLKDHSQ